MQTQSTTGDLTGKVREIMAEVLDVEEIAIPEDVNQQDFSPWTSLEQLTLLVALEEKFTVRFSISEMNRMTSLQAIVACLRQHGL